MLCVMYFVLTLCMSDRKLHSHSDLYLHLALLNSGIISFHFLLSCCFSLSRLPSLYPLNQPRVSLFVAHVCYHPYSHN